TATAIPGACQRLRASATSASTGAGSKRPAARVGEAGRVRAVRARAKRGPVFMGSSGRGKWAGPLSGSRTMKEYETRLFYESFGRPYRDVLGRGPVGDGLDALAG